MLVGKKGTMNEIKKKKKKEKSLNRQKLLKADAHGHVTRIGNKNTTRARIHNLDLQMLFRNQNIYEFSSVSLLYAYAAIGDLQSKARIKINKVE